MVTILFWNLSKDSNILPHLACLGLSHLIDIFILAECPDDLDPAIIALNSLNNGIYHEEFNTKIKVRALTRLGIREFTHHFTNLNSDMIAWVLKSPKLTPAEVLVVGVHIPSKAGGLDSADQAMIAQEVTKQLNDLEDQRKHRNTLIVGDFNMHPYDPGMTSVAGLHGLMTRKLAERPDRRYREQLRRRFYNPMWGLFGDQTPGPAGSFYWRSSNPHNTHWSILDQVLLRPALISFLKDLRILDHDGNHTLMSSDDAPSTNHMSDHLPILFRLDL